MSVKKGDRRDSKVEFDNIYFRIHDDAIKLIQNYFGAKKKYKKRLENGLMTENDIYNCYMSWRNAVLKDCNACHKSIESMDNLYKSLFPEHEKSKKLKRSEIIDKAFKELYESKYDRIRKNDTI